jgi:hypothetical protein
MNRKMKKVLNFILSVFEKMLIICLTIFGIYYTGEMFDLAQKALTGTDKEIIVALIIACSTIVVTVITLVVGKYYEKKKEIENSLRNKKIPVYEEFVSFTFKVLNKEIDLSKNIEKSNKLFLDITQKLIIWGSDDVLNQWMKFRNNAQEGKSENIVFDLEKIMYVIRKDLGHKNYEMEKGDILKLFVSDIQTKK